MIGLEAILVLLLGLTGGRMLSGGFLGGYFNVVEPDMLKFGLSPAGYISDLFGLFGFLGALLIAYHAWSARKQYRFFLTISLLTVAAVFFFQLTGRLIYGTTYGTHDGMVQSEVAARMVLDGINPYQANFAGTPFAFFHPPLPDGSPKPVLQHYAYPPLTFLIIVPVVWLSQLMQLPADGRLMTVIAYALLCVMLIRILPQPRQKIWAVLGLLMNPFAYGYPLIGFNDIFFITAIVLTAIFAHHKRWLLAGLMLGIAIGSKQTAVLALPLWGMFLWFSVQARGLKPGAAWRSLAMTGGMALLVYAPFIIWNTPAMYDDLVRYVSGAIPYSYPIAGDSLWQFLVIFQRVPDAWALTHHGWWVAGAVVVVLTAAIHWLRRRPTPSQWLLMTAATITVTSLFNRYFYENYTSTIVWLVIAAYILQLREQGQSVSHDLRPVDHQRLPKPKS